MRSTEFDSYIIYHEEEKGAKIKNVVHCFLDGKTVGYIEFVEGEVPDPEVVGSGVLRLFFPFARFANIINTIRYEKPLYLSIYNKKSVVSTVREPVGEQEGHEDRGAWK